MYFLVPGIGERKEYNEQMTKFTFKITQTENNARRGVATTPHGEFNTPAFMPVGTQGSVKGVDCERLREVGSEITLVNTYHLMLRPGPSLIEKLGGIQEFTGWRG